MIPPKSVEGGNDNEQPANELRRESENAGGVGCGMVEEIASSDAQRVASCGRETEAGGDDSAADAESELTAALRLFEALTPAAERGFLRQAIDGGELPKHLRAAMLAMLDTAD